MRKMIVVSLLLCLTMALFTPTAAVDMDQGNQEGLVGVIKTLQVGKEYTAEELFTKETTKNLRTINFPTNRLFSVYETEEGYSLQVSENVALRVDQSGV